MSSEASPSTDTSRAISRGRVRPWPGTDTAGAPHVVLEGMYVLLLDIHYS